jgi:hypothetical protein
MIQRFYQGGESGSADMDKRDFCGAIFKVKVLTVKTLDEERNILSSVGVFRPPYLSTENDALVISVCGMRNLHLLIAGSACIGAWESYQESRK